MNVVAKKVALRVEALSPDDKVLATSKTLTGDTTKRQIEWNECTDLSALSCKPIRFRFYFTNEQLFAFLVTPDPNDASNWHVVTDGGGVREIGGSVKKNRQM